MTVKEYLTFCGIDATRDSKGEFWFNCPFHEEDTPSCSMNEHTEKWNCFGCNAKGLSINTFDSKLKFIKGKTMPQSKTVDETLILEKNHCLLSRTDVVQRLWDEKKIGVDVLRKYKIGWDGRRLWIPVYKNGKAFNVKMWDVFKLNHKKYMWFGKKEDGYVANGYVFPEDSLKNTDIFYAEGEGDCLTALSAGYHAITGGGTTFDFIQILSQLKNKKVSLCYDNDPAGKEAEKKALERIGKSSGISVRAIQLSNLGAEDGQDFTDCICKVPAFKDTLKQYLTTLPFQKKEGEEKQVSLSTGISAQYYKKNISFHAHIISLSAAPKQIAKQILAISEDGGKESFELDIAQRPEIAVSLYKSDTHQEQKILRRIFNIDSDKKIIIQQTYNLVEMFLQQDFCHSEDVNDPVSFQIPAYTTEYQICPYKTYKFTAKVLRRADTLEVCFFILESETKKMQNGILLPDDLSWLNLFNPNVSQNEKDSGE